MLDFFVLKSDPDLVKMESEDNAYRALFDCYKVIMHLADSDIASMDSLSKTL